MVKQIESLGRGLRVLSILETGGAYSLSELAHRTGLPKSTLLRMLETLRTEGFARKRRTDGHWQAGLSRFNGSDPQSDILAETVAPVLDALCAQIAWPSDVGVYDKGGIRVLESSRRLSPFMVNRDVLARHVHVLPSAMGRAILAWSSPARQEEIIADLARTNALPESLSHDRAGVRALIAETRARGYATRQHGYFVTAPSEAKVMAMALPVFAFGEPIAAINVVWIGTAMSEDDFARIHLPRLRDAAEIVTKQMGDGRS